MRVAHLITRLILGGAQENTLHTVDDQHHLFGDEVCLITGPGLGPEGTLIPRAQSRNLDVRVLPELHRALHPRLDLQACRSIARQLRKYKPDIVHTHSSKAGILGRLVAHRLKLPVVHTIHGASFHYGQRPWQHWIYRSSERLADKWCQHFISVCDSMSRQYLDAGIGHAGKFTTIYSGMDVNQFLSPQQPAPQLRQRLGLRPEHIVVGKIARLFHLKGHEYVIDAAARIIQAVPHVRFLWVGDGILRETFEKRIHNLGLQDYFVFAGLVPPEHVSDYIHAMDIVVHTSVWEGLARVLPQASLAGKPTVSFAIDGAPEVCIHEHTGLLVAPRNVTELADAVIRLASDVSLRYRLGQNGRDFCRERFCHRRMTHQIREVYQQVLQAVK